MASPGLPESITDGVTTGHVTDHEKIHDLLNELDMAAQVQATGDLLVVEDGLVRRLPVGADSQVLTADSAQPAGVKWATPSGGGGGGGGGTAPAWVEALAVTDSPNASDDEFNDESIDPAWTEILVSGNATWSEANDLLTVAYDSQSSGDAAAILKEIPATPTAPIEIRTAIRSLGVGNHQAIGLVFTAGTGGADGSIWFRYNLTDSSVGLYGGSLTNLQASQLRQVSISQRQVPWLHLALRWESANTWAIRFSTDGATWSSFGQADASFTLTPTHFGLAVSRFGGGTPALASFEYFRIA